MDDRAKAGEGVAEDDDFTVAQDTEFDEAEQVASDEERPLDDSLVEDRPGIDAERRVDVSGEPQQPAEEA
ncbi:hypothetical protein ACGGZK_15680 [Agromyces sp. MMS24-K17]|uniref:hypothetical protein n=1 Tax=Agromyces sp. MMS24-K17 TaxID=3372850 RepID=UPI003754C189